MATWTWRCLLDNQSATGTTYDDVVSQARTHNSSAGHARPQISYGNDFPPPDPTPGNNLLQIGSDLATSMSGLQQIIDGVNSGTALTSAQKDQALKLLAQDMRRVARLLSGLADSVS